MSDNNGPNYKLIQHIPGIQPCKHHATESLVNLYNDPLWIMQTVSIDKIMFTCAICHSERVYQIQPEKTLL